MDSAETLAKLGASTVDPSRVRNDNPFGNHSPIELAYTLSGLGSTATSLVYYLWLGDVGVEESLLRELLVESVGVAQKNKWDWKLKGKAEHLRSLVFAELKGVKYEGSCEPCKGNGHIFDVKVTKCPRCNGAGRSAMTNNTKSHYYASCRIELSNPNFGCMDNIYRKYTSEYKKWIREGRDIRAMIAKIDMDARNHIKERL